MTGPAVRSVPWRQSLSGLILAGLLMACTINLVVAGVSLEGHHAVKPLTWAFLVVAILGTLGGSAWLLNRAPVYGRSHRMAWLGGIAAGVAGSTLMLPLYLHWLTSWF